MLTAHPNPYITDIEIDPDTCLILPCINEGHLSILQKDDAADMYYAVRLRIANPRNKHPMVALADWLLAAYHEAVLAAEADSTMP
jgi:hypothetical protein